MHFITPQQTMARLARTNRVLYVNLTHSIGGALLHKKVRDRFSSKPMRRLDVEGELYEYSPPPIFLPTGTLPASLSNVTDKINGPLFASVLKKHMEALGFQNPILWIFNVRWPTLLDGIKTKLRVYDCIDEWGSWSGHVGGLGRQKAAYAEQQDRRLVLGSDITFVVSRSLFESKQSLTSSVYHVPNAADFELFHQSTSEDVKLADDMPQGQGPVIGYIGYLDHRLDTELLIKLARKRPEWQIVLVGPALSEDIPAPLHAAGLPNLKLLGPKHRSELAGYLKGFDVSIVPYKIDGFTRNIYPLKLYEYMASGKPIVSSPIPAVVDEQPLVDIASTAEEFSSAIGKCLAEPNRELEVARIELARQNTWDARVERKSELIEALLQDRARQTVSARSA